MGFSATPPRNDPTIVVAAINYWAQRADAAIIHASPPWAALIGGAAPAAAVDSTQVPLANYYRAKGLALVFTVDATDGLNRAAEAPELVARGRSITDTAIQRLYHEWVFAVADKLRPEYLGLAAETNLIRALAPDSVYQAVVVMTFGNPQAVVLGPLPPDERFRRLGAALERHEIFPNGTNVEFAHIEAPDAIRIIIWERGVGPTTSSGTGSCAALVAAAAFGGAASAADVIAPGGAQRVEWLDDSVYLTGWAELICEGQWLRDVPIDT